MNKLTIAISTLKSNREHLVKHIGTFPDIDNVEFLIISQGEIENITINLNSNVKLIKSTSYGLSRSRNIAISSVNTEWVWFQDDDISLIFEGLPSLIEELCSSIDACFVKVRSSESKSEYYKDYSFHRKHNILNCFKISSIEILARVEFLKKFKLNFDEKLGLGTRLPCCEESLFLYGLFKNTDKCTYIKLPVAYHTTNIESRDIDFSRRMIARGYSLRYFPKVLSFLLFMRWGLSLSNPNGAIYRYKLLLEGMMLK
ncbi:hypothetical protein SE23_17140 [Vibrio sinaloensis]|uniref:glycosyltransferase family 2 protein n=1 Tax=Photobacterium sp. (strain ATCC 43367) TaxID=379097 RepID=UPI00057F670C|nr:glycosyltransferase family A protein [Vibrio sinaloensis]KIE19443.1 hypothetical protein SE23_17140 [Vibrio sinaloensis]